MKTLFRFVPLGPWGIRALAYPDGKPIRKDPFARPRPVGGQTVTQCHWEKRSIDEPGSAGTEEYI